jgi:hypothetical protein
MVSLLLALETSSRGSKPSDGASEIVPKMHLHATHEKVLDAVDMEGLKEYAAEPEARNGSNVAQDRKGVMCGAIEERTELAGKVEMTGKEL